MITIPATNLPAQSAVDFEFTLTGSAIGKPVLLAPAGGTLDPSWNGACWLAWTRAGASGYLGAAGLGAPSGYTGSAAPDQEQLAVLHVRVVNPTTGALALAQQQFNFTTFQNAS